MYGHSPFGADSAPGGDHLHRGPSHMLALPHTSPSEHEVRITVAPIVVLVVAMLRAFGRHPEPLRILEVLCSSASAKGLEKLVTQKEKIQCRRQVRVCLF